MEAIDTRVTQSKSVQAEQVSTVLNTVRNAVREIETRVTGGQAQDSAANALREETARTMLQQHSRTVASLENRLAAFEIDNRDHHERTKRQYKALGDNMSEQNTMVDFLRKELERAHADKSAQQASMELISLKRDLADYQEATTKKQAASNGKRSRTA